MNKLRADQIRQIEQEMNTLIQQAQQQLDQLKLSLKMWVKEIRTTTGAYPTFDLVRSLMDWVDEIKLDMARTAPMGEEGVEVQVAHSMPDGLVAFLQTPPEHLVLPEPLKNYMKGSHIIEPKAVARRAP